MDRGKLEASAGERGEGEGRVPVWKSHQRFSDLPTRVSQAEAYDGLIHC